MSQTTQKHETPVFKPAESSVLPHIALLLVQLMSLAGPRTHSRKNAFLAVVVGLFAITLYEPYFTTDIGKAQPFSIAWPSLLSTFEKICLSGDEGPEGNFWRVDKPAKEAAQYTAFGLSKVRWATVLLLNIRGVRWNFEVKNIRKLSRESSRASFCMKQSFLALYYFLMADIVSHLGIQFLYTLPNGRSVPPLDKSITLDHPLWYWSITKCFVFGATPYYVMNLQYALGSVVFVLLHISQPQDWPPLFNSISTARDVRSFWGTYWHQTIRRPVSSLTGAFVDAAGITRGTKLSSYSQLWLAFAISGFFHANSMRMLPTPLNVTLKEQTSGVFLFFLSQAAAITFEDFVKWCWHQVTPQESSRTLEILTTTIGYTWVFAAIWKTLPLAGNVLLRTRIGQDPLFPVSVAAPYIAHVPVPP